MKPDARVRRMRRRNTKVRITKAQAKKIGITGQRPVVKVKKRKNNMPKPLDK